MVDEFVREFLSVEPVIWMPMQVHRCLNDDFVRINSVQKGIGEAVDKATTDVKLYDRPPFRVFANVLDCGVDLVQEIIAKTGCLQFIVPRRVEHLQFGRT